MRQTCEQASKLKSDKERERERERMGRRKGGVRKRAKVTHDVSLSQSMEMNNNEPIVPSSGGT